MNFRVLYGWYIAIVAVMLFSTCIKISNVVEGFANGYDVAYENVAEKVEKNDDLPMIWAGSNIKIQASDLKGIEFPVKIESEEADAKVELTPMAYTVLASGNIGDRSKIMTLSALQLFVAISVLVISVMVLIYIVKLFVRISSALKCREIFDLRVIKTMRILGWLLLGQVVVNTVFSYIQTALGESVLHGYDIDVVFYGEIDYTKILLAFVTIMISEIFKIGYNIREEQSLTI